MPVWRGGVLVGGRGEGELFQGGGVGYVWERADEGGGEDFPRGFVEHVA